MYDLAYKLSRHTIIGTIVVTMETRHQYSAHYLETVSHCIACCISECISYPGETTNCPPADSLILDKPRGRKGRLHSCLKILSS